VLRMPSERGLCRNAHGLRVVPPERLQRHDGPEPQRGGIPARLHRLSWDVVQRLVGRDFYPHRVHASGPPRRGGLLRLPRQRRLPGTSTNARLPSRGL
jgi:hypothetical protein